MQVDLNSSRLYDDSQLIAVWVTGWFSGNALVSTLRTASLGKVKWIYIAPSHKPSKALRHGSHSVTCVKVKWIYIAPSHKPSKVLRHGSHSVTCVKVKVKWIYIAPGHKPSKVLRHGSHSVTCVKVKWIYIAPGHKPSKVLRHGSHSVTCNYTDPCLYLVSVHQMAPPQTEAVNI